MLRPSYSDLLEVITQDAEDITIGSRYTIVIAAAKRARQIIAGDEPMVDTKPGEKALSTAIDELNNAQLKILADETEE